jgi:AcrR family transcriptional regulator
VTTAPSRYQLAQQESQDALRRTVLDTASELLVEEGPQALTMRKLAGALGCSTTVLYTMFGGKDGIADALFLEGFARLRRRLEAVPSDLPPMERLRGIGQAYRENALAERPYYGVMFEQALPGYQPSPESLALSRTSLAVLTETVEACIAAGLLRAADPIEVTEVLWAAVHGAVSLELAGKFADPELAEQRFIVLSTAASAAYRAQ